MDFWIHPDQCTGCGACNNACPKGAIKLEWNERGYSAPVINQELCINCDLCRRACPVGKILNDTPLATEPKRKEPKIYAAWSRTYNTRYNSTSGGAFSELAKVVLQDGGYIAGAVYDENQMVHHIVSNKPEDLERIRQSKYTQSETRKVFQQIRKLLAAGERVLYCGAPCQVAGLYEYLHGDHEGLTTVDFICRGINSPLAYRKWLDDLEKEYGAKAKKVWFKNKECGWNTFSTRVDFENGKHYRQTRYEDLFMRAYLQFNLFIRPSCTECNFKGMPRIADLTLADFWKIEKELDADLGTSMIIVNSEKGDRLFEQAKLQLQTYERSYEEALKGNACLTTSAKHGRNSEAFFEELARGSSFSKAFRNATGDWFPKLSVILAIDSPTKYFSKAVRSILAQDYPNLELLLICASEDEALRRNVIMQSRTDERIRLLPAVSDMTTALNNAVKEASGEYFHFVTGREEIYPDSYRSIIRQMLENLANVACFGWHNEKKRPMCQNAFNGTGNVQSLLHLLMTAEDYTSEYLGYGSTLWNKIFRRDMLFVDEQPIEFVPNGYAMQNLFWLLKVAFGCNTAFYTQAAMLQRLVPNAPQDITANMALEELFAQETEALQLLEDVYPTAYDTLRLMLFDYEVNLASSCERRDMPRLKSKLTEHMVQFLDVPKTKEEIVNSFVSGATMRLSNAQLTARLNRANQLIDAKNVELTKATTNLSRTKLWLSQTEKNLAQTSASLKRANEYIKKRNQAIARRDKELKETKAKLNGWRKNKFASAGMKLYNFCRKVKRRLKKLIGK